MTMPGYMWAAGLVSATSAKSSQTGQVSWSVSHASTGIYVITFASAHPLGGNYIMSLSVYGNVGYVRTATPPTSTTFQVATYPFGTTTLTDAIFSFMVLAS